MRKCTDGEAKFKRAGAVMEAAIIFYPHHVCAGSNEISVRRCVRTSRHRATCRNVVRGSLQIKNGSSGREIF